MKKKQFVSLLLGFVVIASFSVATPALAAPTLSAVETVANLSPANDQTATRSTTTANVVGVLASSTFSVNTAPASSTDVTIGDCTINFSSSTGSTDDELDCADDDATVDLSLGAGDTPRTPAQVAGALRSLTNLTQSTRTYILSGSGSQFVATASGTESVAGFVAFTDGTSGSITVVASTSGVVPVAQVITVTIGGTVETGDQFSVILPGPVTASYTVAGGVTTILQIANGLRTAVLASAGYGAQTFTAATTSTAVVFTAKTAGTGFVITASSANRSAVAQTVTFTPGNPESNYDYKVTINGTTYTYRSTNATLQTIVEGITAALASASAVSCSEDNTTVTCVSTSAGTAFTYSASVTIVPASSSGGGQRRITTPPKTETVNVPSSRTTPSLSELQLRAREVIKLATAAGISIPQALHDFASDQKPATDLTVRDLSLGMTGDDVKALQSILIEQGHVIPAGPTGTFGQQTKAALSAYQTKAGIVPAAGYFGPKTRASMKDAGLSGLWW